MFVSRGLSGILRVVSERVCFENEGMVPSLMPRATRRPGN